MGAAADAENIKALTVSGAEAAVENVQDGSYPLSRPFSLAWSGTLSELKQDFLTYVLGSGQAIVGQSYVAVEQLSLPLRAAGRNDHDPRFQLCRVAPGGTG